MSSCGGQSGLAEGERQHPQVQCSFVRAVGHLKPKGAVARLAPFLDNSDGKEYVGRRACDFAAEALANICPDAPEAERDKVIAAWREWVKEK